MRVAYWKPVALTWLCLIFTLVAFSTTWWMKTTEQLTIKANGNKFKQEVKANVGLWRGHTSLRGDLLDDDDDQSIDCEADESKSCDSLIASQAFASMFLIVIVIVAFGSTAAKTFMRQFQLPMAWGSALAVACLFNIVAAATYDRGRQLKNDQDGPTPKADDDTAQNLDLDLFDFALDYSFILWMVALGLAASAAALFFSATEDTEAYQDEGDKELSGVPPSGSASPSTSKQGEDSKA